MTMDRRTFLGSTGALVAGGWFVRGAPALGGDNIRVLILSGQNNHDWRRTTPFMQQILESTGKFDVRVSTAPPNGSPPEAWDAWRPDFAACDLVLSDYNGELWPEPVRDHFVKFVADGGRVVIQHAANNAFPGWREYEQMVGLLWRGAGEGARMYWNEDNQLVREPAGEGIGAGHGGLHDWPIAARQTAHPIFADMPNSWMHAHDELYHGQRGPAENLNVLATAKSTRASGGTGWHEPIVWWVPYETGRVLTFLPGHLWGGQEDTRAFRCIGFRCLLQRCCQWLVTDHVDIPVPDPFPTAQETLVGEAAQPACCFPRRTLCDIC